MNSNDVVMAIKSGQEGANEYSRINLGLPPVQTFAFEYFRNTKIEKPQKFLPIQDISNFYNLISVPRTDGRTLQLYNYLLSRKRVYIIIFLLYELL